MSLPLCTPDKIDCVGNIETKYEECLPKCSGLWVNSFDKEKNINLDKQIWQLSEQYWNYKGYYEFSRFKGYLKFSHNYLTKNIFDYLIFLKYMVFPKISQS